MNSKLRTYDKNTQEFYLYKQMHENQSLEYAVYKREYYKRLKKAKMSMKNALKLLDYFVDPSDPDLDVSNSIHAYQTAERIRAAHPENKEMQVVGLIHDVGKILYSFGEPDWSVVGDTYIMGCEFPMSIVYYETLKQSLDLNKYPGCGIYEKGCGLSNTTVSFGHDEYLYWVLQGNKKSHKITDRYMNVIRYHSLYPWHTGGAYRDLMNESDKELLRDVLEFNKFDLYSKEDSVEISNEVKFYYDKLLDEFFSAELKW